jgi:hypothetical protein
VLVQALAVGVQAGQVDEIDLVKIAQLQLGLGLQRVMLGQHAHHVGAEQQFTISAARYLLDLGQAKVMLLGNQRLLQQGRLLRQDAHAHAAVLLVTLQALGNKVCENSGRQVMASLPARNCGWPGQSGRSAPARHSALDLFDQQQRLGGGRQAPTFALEQVQAGHLLQARQLAADSGLRGEQQARGTGDTASGHDGAEHFDVADGQFHGSTRWVDNGYIRYE